MKNLSFVGCPDYSVTTEGRIFSLKSDRFLKPYVSSGGYFQIQLRTSENKKKTFMLHRLVMLAFVENTIGDTAEVNHIDGDKSNNSLLNLEWCTPKQNVQHTFKELTHSNRKLSDETVHLVCKYLQDGLRVKDVATLCGVERHDVSNIKSGGAFSWISCDYDFSLAPSKSKTLSDSKIIKVCELLQEKVDYASIVRQVGVTRQQVYDIRHRKYFTRISDNFSF